MPRYLAFLGLALLAAALCSAEINIPHAGEAHFAPDATADRLMKEQQEADPVMDFLEDLMAKPDADTEETTLVEVLPAELHLHMPNMPPSATEADHEIDPEVERLVKDDEAESRQRDEGLMLGDEEDTMLGDEEERQAKADAQTQVGLSEMDDDANTVAKEQADIEKAQQDKEVAERALAAKVDRMAAISAHVFSKVAHATAGEDAEQEDVARDVARDAAHAALTETEEPVVPGSAAAATHTAAPHPPHAHEYSATPIGVKQQRSAAQLGKGAHSASKEDWAVEQAAYRRIHPHKKKAKKVVKMKTPTPLKEAKKEFKIGLHHIRQTQKLEKFHPHLMTLPEAKGKCAKIRANAESKCKKITKDASLFCQTLKVTKEACAEKKLKQAATCKVVHETAYNQCLGLFHKAKANAAVVDERTDVASGPVKNIEATATGATTCAKVFAASHKKCTAELKVYKDTCAKTKHESMVAMVVSELVALNSDKKASKATPVATLKKQAAAAAKKASKVAASVHQTAKTLKGAKMSPAAVKCHKLKAKAKAVCDDTATKAKAVCRHAMQGSEVFEEFITLPRF